jgi:hypothetical protein
MSIAQTLLIFYILENIFFVDESTMYIGHIPDKNIGQSTEGVIGES